MDLVCFCVSLVFPPSCLPLTIPSIYPKHHPPFVQHLVEKSWYAVLETFILLAGFHQDMQLGFVATIALLFVVKAFHWLAEERIDYVS